MSDTTAVLFGNPNPQMQVRQGDSQISEPAAHLNQSVTRIDFDPSTFDQEKVELTLSTDNDRMLILVANSLDEEHKPYAIGVYEAEEIMGVHSAGIKPTWVSCPDDPGFEAALAAHFKCAQGEPVNVLTEFGRDKMHEQHLKSTGQPVGFEYGALSPSVSTPEAANTVLAEEIITASGGLIRQKMTFAHTVGTNTSTLTSTWTGNASDAYPVTIKKWANFNLAKQSEGSGKGMGEIDNLNASATLAASGDSITVTFTLTAG